MAKIYWRTIKRGTRKFSDIPANLKEEVKEIAKQEVKQNIITEQQYSRLIGEVYSE